MLNPASPLLQLTLDIECTHLGSAPLVSSGELKDSPPEPPSQDEIKFDEVVKSLLASKHSHLGLKQRLRNLVMEETRNIPPVKVLLCISFGEFSLSNEFESFRAPAPTVGNKYIGYSFPERHDPVLIKAIIDYGRFICEKCPHVLDDMRTFRRWELSQVLGTLPYRRSVAQYWPLGQPVPVVETDPDLLAKAEEFFKQNTDEHGQWRPDKFEGHPKTPRYPSGPGSNDFVAFAELHPDVWMCYGSFGFGVDTWPGEVRCAIRFARVLLKDDFARYQVGPDEKRDAAIYEYIGLLGASTPVCMLGMGEVPALIHYTIRDHGGYEEVEY